MSPLIAATITAKWMVDSVVIILIIAVICALLWAIVVAFRLTDPWR